MPIKLSLLFVFGLIGSVVAYYFGVPMPFLLGSLAGSAVFILGYESEDRKLPKLSRWVRLVFISIIGTMIGSRFTPELLSILPHFWVSAIAILPYIAIALGGNYFIMRKFGKYSQLDSFFAALPGGIVDSIALAEEVGANVNIVTAQHFIRIILVVITVPLLFLFVTGSAVGSLAGESIAANEYNLVDVITIIIIALAGLFVGRYIRLPVSHMMGPLLLSLALSVSGVIEINIPIWLQNLAQYMVGTALGAQFSGISKRLLVKGLGLGIVTGIFMLSLAVVCGLVLSKFVPASFEAVFISFAAGGLAEMSLIGLTLNFNPIVVALHHLARIFLTVLIGGFLVRRFFVIEENR